MQVWQMAGTWRKVNYAFLVTNSTIEAIFSLLQNLSQEHAQRLATICWRLWKHCNLKLWKNDNELFANIADKARHLIEDLQDANIIHSASDDQQTTSTSHTRFPMASSFSSTVGRDVHW